MAEYIIITIHVDIYCVVWCVHMAQYQLGGFSDFVAAVVSLALVVVVYVVFGSSVVALFVVVVTAMGGYAA